MNRFRPLILLVLLLSTVAAAVPATAAKYDVDVAHSSVGFEVKHMAISKTRGTFDDYSASFTFEPGKPETWSCEAVIQVASVNTNNEKRDEHLRSEDFFEVAKFPAITFKSTSVKMEDENEGVMTGELTIHGVTKTVELEFELLGTVTDPWGNERAGFSAETKINRKDFGLTYNSVLETGGLMIGETVKITLEIEGIQAK